MIPWKAYCHAFEQCGGISTSMSKFRGWASKIKKEQFQNKDMLING